MQWGVAMERRNSEEQDHVFANEVAKYCHIHDLQGLLMDSDNHFSAAVEAVATRRDENVDWDTPVSLFSKDEVLAKIGIANALGVDFYVFFHKRGSETIQQYQVTRASAQKGIGARRRAMPIMQFLNWWGEYKRTIQIKECLRSRMRKAVAKSDFDNILENYTIGLTDKGEPIKSGQKWGGNVDAFLSSDDGDYRPIAIIENRFTEQNSIEDYDPSDYFASDVSAWNPLFLAAKTLNIPLILCVYSKRPGERHKIAMAEIDVNRSTDHLEYVNVPKPGENILESKEAAKEWFDNVLCRWQNPMPA